MKSIKRIILGFALLGLPAVLSAQTGGGEFRITGRSIGTEGELLRVVLDIEASRLNLGHRAALELIPSLRSGGNELPLPGVRYQGGKFEGGESGFLSVYKGVRPEDLLVTPYAVSVPHEPWMDNAELVFRQFLREGDKVEEFPVKVMIGDIAVNNPPVDRSWHADPAVFRQMAMFLQPTVEKVKTRSATTAVKIDFPSGKTTIIADYGNNAAELYRIDTLLRNILGDKFVKVNSITITGYSSPDGAYATNQRLATARAKDFHQYLASKHNLRGVRVVTRAVGEDWDSLVAAVQAGDMQYRDEVLKIIASTDIFDGREKKLMNLRGGAPYRYMLQNMFPALRRIGIEIDYVVRSLNDQEARELLYTRPQMLSLSEMMRAASYYEPGTSEYRKVYEIAATHFPNDVVASNNAAAAALLDGDADAAARHLDGVDDKRVLVNRGVISYIAGDTVPARKSFTAACEAGIEKGCSNLELLGRSVDGRNARLAAAQEEYERVEAARTAALGQPLGISIDRSSHAYRFAVKTNLMEWAGLFPNFSGLRGGVNYYGVTPNIEAEVFFRERWSVNADGIWGDFITQDDRTDRRWALSRIGVEPRIWLGKANSFKGVYAGVYGSYGEFNMLFPGMDLPVSGDIFSAGISVGYAYLFTPRWSVEAGLRAGYFSNDYFRYFHNPAAGRFEWDSDHAKSGFGLQSLRLTVGYRFGKM